MRDHRTDHTRVAGPCIAILLAAGLLSACECSRPAEEAPTAAATPAPESAGTPETPLPPEGEFFVAVKARDDVTVLANHSQRTPILRELEKQMGFRLALRAGEPAGPVSVRAEHVTFEVALAQVLRGYLYAIVYDVDLHTGEQEISQVKVGHEDPDAIYETNERGEKVAKADVIDPSKFHFDTAPKADPEEFEESQAVYYQQFEDPDPAVRAEAAEWIYPDEEAVPALGNLLTSDPDPAVRAAAADGLKGALDNPDAVDVLLKALRDPEPEVLLATLDALEFLGDETIVRDLSPLLQHPDARVRERTVEVIAWLE